jgi:hypothetical protein
MHTCSLIPMPHNGIHCTACNQTQRGVSILAHAQTIQKACKSNNDQCYLFLAPLLIPKRFRTSPTNLRARKNGIKCSKSLSVGSDIQPSIGIAFSAWSTSPNTLWTNLHAMHSLLANCPGCKLSLDLVPQPRGP